MKIAIASDHGGFALKQEIAGYLRELGHEAEDFGCHSAESCDYPDFAGAAARAVAAGDCERGIVVCSTGIPAAQQRQHAGSGRLPDPGPPGQADY